MGTSIGKGYIFNPELVQSVRGAVGESEDLLQDRSLQVQEKDFYQTAKEAGQEFYASHLASPKAGILNSFSSRFISSQSTQDDVLEARTGIVLKVIHDIQNGVNHEDLEKKYSQLDIYLAYRAVNDPKIDRVIKRVRGSERQKELQPKKLPDTEQKARQQLVHQMIMEFFEIPELLKKGLDFVRLAKRDRLMRTSLASHVVLRFNGIQRKFMVELFHKERDLIVAEEQKDNPAKGEKVARLVVKEIEQRAHLFATGTSIAQRKQVESQHEIGAQLISEEEQQAMQSIVELQTKDGQKLSSQRQLMERVQRMKKEVTSDQQPQSNEEVKSLHKALSEYSVVQEMKRKAAEITLLVKQCFIFNIAYKLFHPNHGMPKLIAEESEATKQQKRTMAAVRASSAKDMVTEQTKKRSLQKAKKQKQREAAIAAAFAEAADEPDTPRASLGGRACRFTTKAVGAGLFARVVYFGTIGRI